MVTYNHKRFLAQAIESALTQRTDFPFEIVLSDDCSTDGAPEIARRFAQRYPERIRLLSHEANLGLTRNIAQTIEACRGEYVANLEGDDYWTHPEKLQRQVDYLDANKDCTWCFTRATVIDADGGAIAAPPVVRTVRPKYSLADYLERQFQPRFCTVMFRHRLFSRFPEWYYRMPTADLPLHVFNSETGGLIGFVDEEMAAYRIHQGGVWSQGMKPTDWATQSPEHVAKLARRDAQLVELYDAVDRHLDGAHRKILRRQIAVFAEEGSRLNRALGDRRALRRSAWAAVRAQASIGKLPRLSLFAALLEGCLPFHVRGRFRACSPFATVSFLAC